MGFRITKNEVVLRTKKNNSKPYIKRWNEFLLSECIKPYQTLLKFTNKDIPPFYIAGQSRHKGDNQFLTDDFRYFFDVDSSSSMYAELREGFAYSNRLNELALKCMADSDGGVFERLDNLYSNIYVLDSDIDIDGIFDIIEAIRANTKILVKLC